MINWALSYSGAMHFFAEKVYNVVWANIEKNAIKKTAKSNFAQKNHQR